MSSLFEDVGDEPGVQWAEQAAKVIRLNDRRRMHHAVKQAQRNELISKARSMMRSQGWPERVLMQEFGARRLEGLSDGVLMRVFGALCLLNAAMNETGAA
jgi:hypothetical protein